MGEAIGAKTLHAAAFVDFVARHGLPPLDERSRARFDGRRNRYQIQGHLPLRDTIAPANGAISFAGEKTMFPLRLRPAKLILNA